MAAEFKRLDAIKERRIIKIAKLLMPLLAKSTSLLESPTITALHTNTIGYPIASTELGLVLPNGNKYSISCLLEYIFFEQLVHFGIWEFYRPDKKPVLRIVPLITKDFYAEKAECFNWINTQQQAGKRGADITDWFRIRILEIYKVDIDSVV